MTEPAAASSINTSYVDFVPDQDNFKSRIQMIDDFKDFLRTAPADSFTAKQGIITYTLPITNEPISCVYWSHAATLNALSNASSNSNHNDENNNKAFFISGTDIVRSLLFRFIAFGRPIHNLKKFEEGIFSDLRNLKPGLDAILEEPKSPFLDFLFKHNCIRTQKKQKVFYWRSVPHDRLFLDALERDLKREKLKLEATSTAVAEPALSMTLDTTQAMFDEFRKTMLSELNLMTTSEDKKIRRSSKHSRSSTVIKPIAVKLEDSSEDQQQNTNVATTNASSVKSVSALLSPSFSSSPSPTSFPAKTNSSNLLGRHGFSLFEGCPTYKQRRRRVTQSSITSTTLQQQQEEEEVKLQQQTNSRSCSTSSINSSSSSSSCSSGSNGSNSKKPSILKLLISHDHRDSTTHKVSKKKYNHKSGTNSSRNSHFRCPLNSCAKIFKRLEHMKRHLRTHTMERPYVCDVCGKRFSRSDNLSQHKKTHVKASFKTLGPGSSSSSSSEDDDDDNDNNESNDEQDVEMQQVNGMNNKSTTTAMEYIKTEEDEYSVRRQQYSYAPESYDEDEDLEYEEEDDESKDSTYEEYTSASRRKQTRRRQRQRQRQQQQATSRQRKSGVMKKEDQPQQLPQQRRKSTLQKYQCSREDMQRRKWMKKTGSKKHKRRKLVVYEVFTTTTDDEDDSGDECEQDEREEDDMFRRQNFASTTIPQLSIDTTNLFIGANQMLYGADSSGHDHEQQQHHDENLDPSNATTPKPIIKLEDIELFTPSSATFDNENLLPQPHSLLEEEAVFVEQQRPHQVLHNANNDMSTTMDDWQMKIDWNQYYNSTNHTMTAITTTSPPPSQLEGDLDDANSNSVNYLMTPYSYYYCSPFQYAQSTHSNNHLLSATTSPSSLSSPTNPTNSPNLMYYSDSNENQYTTTHSNSSSSNNTTAAAMIDAFLY